MLKTDLNPDTVIRASFLRAASREELVYSDVTKEKERSAALTLLMKSAEPDKSNVALEFILASALDKCSIDDIGDDLDPIPGAKELLAFIAKH